MSTNWQNKGWKNMESILDQAMPVQRRPLFAPFPVPLRFAALALIIIGSAYWGFNLLNSDNTLTVLGAFDLQQDQEAASLKLESLQFPLNSTSLSESALPVQRTKMSSSSTLLSIETIKSNFNQLFQFEQSNGAVLVENIQSENELVFNPAQSSVLESSEINSSNSELLAQAGIIEVQEKITFSEMQDEALTNTAIESTTDLADIVPTVSAPIINPKFQSYFSIGVSVGNYTFAGPTMYGQVQANLHIPISKSIHLVFLAAAGKGLLYQNTEVLLAEYNDKGDDGSVLGAGAPADDLSAFVDIKSVSNAVLGTQMEWTISNKWSMTLGVNVGYLFNVQHQAIQSTSLLAEGQSPQQLFTPSEISERFALWNQWDLRMNASLQYHMTQNWSMAFSYNRGFSNLIRHPFSSDHDIRMNALALGINYRF